MWYSFIFHIFSLACAFILVHIWPKNCHAELQWCSEQVKINTCIIRYSIIHVYLVAKNVISENLTFAWGIQLKIIQPFTPQTAKMFMISWWRCVGVFSIPWAGAHKYTHLEKKNSPIKPMEPYMGPTNAAAVFKPGEFQTHLKFWRRYHGLQWFQICPAELLGDVYKMVSKI